MMQSEDILGIGRSADNDIVINNKHISSHHAKLIRTPQALFLEDLGSRNGTFVNSDQIQRKRVHVGDTIKLSQFVTLDWNHPAITRMLSSSEVRPASADSSFTIGRAHNNDIIINDLSVSSNHARLIRTSSGLIIEDLGSRNGTYVDSMKVTSIQIQQGSDVTLGSSSQLNWGDSNLRLWLEQGDAYYRYRPRKTRNTVAWIASSIGAVAAALVLVLTIGRGSDSECSQLTDTSGTAHFIDSGTGEEVSVRVVNEANEPLEGIQVDFIDGDGFETFVALDPQGVIPPVLRIYSHNSMHEIEMLISDLLLPIVKEFIPGSEEYESLMLFTHFLDDMRGEREVETSGPGPEVPDNWLYQGIYTREELERKTQYYLMILTPIFGSGPTMISNTQKKISNILEAMELIEVPELYHSWIIVPSLGESENLAGTMIITMPVGQEWEIVPEPEPAGDASQCPISGMTFVNIPAGSYMMGSPSSQSDRYSDKKQHRVYVSSFELMTTEVTQWMWEEVMGTTIDEMRSRSIYDYGLFGVGDDYPMYYVSWNDCQEFIDALNYLDPNHTYRLPSEAEWEYACRAGTTTRFYWGSSESESTMKNYCWYEKNAEDGCWTSPHASREGTQPVGTKQSNSWGLYDMSGNVLEWCQDVYTSDYDDCPTDGSAYRGSGSKRVMRGGGWIRGAHSCRSAYRLNGTPGFSYYDLGLRLARSAR